LRGASGGGEKALVDAQGPCATFNETAFVGRLRSDANDAERACVGCDALFAIMIAQPDEANIAAGSRCCFSTCAFVLAYRAECRRDPIADNDEREGRLSHKVVEGATRGLDDFAELIPARR
jgi:hypothetical protein